MSCDRNVTKEVADNAVATGALSVNTKRIKDLTTKIAKATNCDAIKLELEITGDELKELTKDVGKEAKKIQEKYLPITKIPTNPLKIIPWAKKLVTGSITPQLEAYIRLLQQLIELAKAVAEFARVAGDVIPKLKECALEIVDDEISRAKGEIEKEVKRVKKKIKDDICGKGEAAGILDVIEGVKDAIDLTNDLIDEIDNIQTSVDSAINNSLATVNEIGTTITGLIGTPFNVDTSSPTAFQQSLDSGALTQFSNDVTTVLNLPPPVNVTAPVLSGTPFVGQTLSCTEGVWSANGVSNNAAFTYTYQWYGNGVEIYGANTNTYVIGVDQVDTVIYCAVTAQNQVNAEEALSNSTAAIDMDETSGSLPAITGTAKVGQTLTCSAGTYPFEPKSVNYTWYRIVGGNRIEVKGEADATEGGNTYAVQSADIGYTIVCKTEARRFKFYIKKYSNPTAVVIP